MNHFTSSSSVFSDLRNVEEVMVKDYKFTFLTFSPGQVITAVKEEIVKAYYPGYFLTSVKGLSQTKPIKVITFDDNYMGTNCHTPLLVNRRCFCYGLHYLRASSSLLFVCFI